jgi:hypothetical protein
VAEQSLGLLELVAERGPRGELQANARRRQRLEARARGGGRRGRVTCPGPC